MFTSGAGGLRVYSGSKQPPERPFWRFFVTTIGVRPHNVNIFNFFHYRIGLDGWNDQTGALGILGVAFGAVSGTVSFGAVLKKRRKFPARARRARGAFFYFFLISSTKGGKALI